MAVGVRRPECVERRLWHDLGVVAAARRRKQERRIDSHHDHAVELVLPTVLLQSFLPEAVHDHGLLVGCSPHPVRRGAQRAKVDAAVALALGGHAQPSREDGRPRLGRGEVVEHCQSPRRAGGSAPGHDTAVVVCGDLAEQLHGLERRRLLRRLVACAAAALSPPSGRFLLKWRGRRRRRRRRRRHHHCGGESAGHAGRE